MQTKKSVFFFSSFFFSSFFIFLFLLIIITNLASPKLAYSANCCQCENNTFCFTNSSFSTLSECKALCSGTGHGIGSIVSNATCSNNICVANNTPSPTNTPVNTPTRTAVNTPTNTPTSTNTPTITNTPSITPTFNTPTNTPVNTDTPTKTPSQTPTITKTPSPSQTPTITNTPKPPAGQPPVLSKVGDLTESRFVLGIKQTCGNGSTCTTAKVAVKGGTNTGEVVVTGTPAPTILTKCSVITELNTAQTIHTSTATDIFTFAHSCDEAYYEISGCGGTCVYSLGLKSSNK